MHHMLEGTIKSPSNFIYPKRGNGKHQENPKGKINIKKWVGESVMQGEGISTRHIHGTPWDPY